MDVNGQEFKVDYVPGDSNSGMFGGNSNWRGVSFGLLDFSKNHHLTVSLAYLVVCQLLAHRVTFTFPHVLRRGSQG